VIVMSDTGMLAHARIALNNTCKFTQQIKISPD